MHLNADQACKEAVGGGLAAAGAGGGGVPEVGVKAAGARKDRSACVCEFGTIASYPYG